MKNIRKHVPLVLSAIIIDVSLLVSMYLYFYVNMPEMMASHWNASGEANGYISRYWGLFLMPFISAVLFGLLCFIPKIDPLKKNIDSFRKEYDWFIFLIILFIFYIHSVTLLWNLGYVFNMSLAVVPGISVLFIYISHLLKVSKRNWFIGIRTPWTLSSDIVWEKTHVLSSKLFLAIGILMLGALFIPDYMAWIILIGVGFTVIIPFVYSYFVFKNLPTDLESK